MIHVIKQKNMMQKNATKTVRSWKKVTSQKNVKKMGDFLNAA